MASKNAAKKSTKQSSKTTVEKIVDIATAVGEALGATSKSEQLPPSTTNEIEQARPVSFYDIADQSKFRRGTKSKQLQAVLDQLQQIVSAPETTWPVRADSLAQVIAANVKDYRVKNGDVIGSVGFHLHVLSNQGLLRKLRMRATDGGWVEVVGEQADTK